MPPADPIPTGADPWPRRRFLGATGLALSALTTACVAANPAAETTAGRSGDSGAAIGSPGSALQRIAFGSCCDQDRPQPIWDAVLGAQPELFIFGGDNVYASAQPWRQERLAAAYARLAAEPGFARLRDRVAHLAIWDDHDYGLNDGGAEFAHKEASKQAFLRFWGAPADDPRRSRPGLYQAIQTGPAGRRLQIILLDTRWFRSPLRPTDQRGATGRERYLPDPDPAKTLLGSAQWTWLEAQLRQPADLRLIVSSTQALAAGHGWECWGNLPGERERLLRLVSDRSVGGALFLSGDRHIGGVYREDLAPGRALMEVTSSGLTHAWRNAGEAGPNRLGELVTDNHFALLDIDWSARAIQLRFIGEQGQLLRRDALPWPAALLHS